MLRLPAHVRVQVAGEAEDVAQNLIGDDIAEEPSKIAQDARCSTSSGKHVVFQTGRERLDPAQSVGAREQVGRNLANERVGARHGGLGGRHVVGVDPLGRARGRAKGRETVELDGRMNDDSS